MTLRNHSWGRTIFHLILLSLILAAVISGFEHARMRGVYEAAKHSFVSCFGNEIKLVSGGFVPEKDPDKCRSVALPDGGKLWYLPDGKISSCTGLEENQYLIFWAPRGFAFAIRNQNGWTFNTAVPEKNTRIFSKSRSIHTAELQKYQLKSGEAWSMRNEEDLNVEELTHIVTVVSLMFLMIQNLMLTLLLPLLYTSVFVGMFRLTSGGRYPIRLTYAQFWKTGIYAGFPALLVASAFPALNLPLFTFSTVYMTGLLIYWLYTAHRLERLLAEEEMETSNEL